MSRNLHSNKMLGLVDWELLVLFIGLFVVTMPCSAPGWSPKPSLTSPRSRKAQDWNSSSCAWFRPQKTNLREIF